LPAVVPAPCLIDLPSILFPPGVVKLCHAVLVVLVVTDDHPSPRVETDLHVAVDGASVRRHRIDNFGAVEGDGKLIRRAVAPLPTDQIFAAGVANIVVGQKSFTESPSCSAKRVIGWFNPSRASIGA